jgi:hypothetical protein
MKQAQSSTTRAGWSTAAAGHWWNHGRAATRIHKPVDPRFDPDFHRMAPGPSWTLGGAIVGLVRMIGFLIALPFRLVFLVIALLGRITGLVVGFLLMVVGTAFLPGPLFVIGIPLLLIGLVLTLRCLE